MTDPTALAGGRYLLVKRLGEGGMATVYRAFDQRLQVWRAIKVLLPEYARKKKIMARFEAEAQTMALLEHPHIVRVYDVDRDDDHAYIVMELVEGGSLVDWLETHGPMPPRLAVDVIVEVCQALQFSHGKGVIHRDIKPHNIMVDRDGVCRLTDFGIARAGDADVNLTKTGAVMGTWGYMAPEQRTDAKHVDARADVYAIAATLYSLLTDKTPMDLFAADHDASMLAGVPEPLVPVLVKATEYRKETRYASANEFAAALLGVRDQLDALPANTPPLQRDLEPLPPPPPSKIDPREAAEPVQVGPGGGETLLPTDASEITGQLTMPPLDDDNLDPGSQHRPVYAPADDDREPSLMGSPQRSGAMGPMLLGIAVVAVIGGVGTAMFLMSGSGATGTDGPEVPVATIPAGPGEASTASVAVPPTATPTASTSTPGAPPPAPVKAPTPTVRPTPPAGIPTPPTGAAPAASTTAPAAATTTPAAVTAPATPAATEVVEAPPPKPPPPPPPSQCFEDVQVATSARMGGTLAFQAKTCLKNAQKVTLYYRPAGTGRWFSKDLSFVLGAHRTTIDVDDTFATGIEWYLKSDGVTYGSGSSPKKASVEG
ncbi:MAG: protein kinase [Alphaproteobacteria bacterium]|nr:protein kinase [Alphaproteobacteria bacterium]